MHTYSGLTLDFLDPVPESIDIVDVARGLSNTCRFGAQAQTFYSVAQHVVMVSTLLTQNGRNDLAGEGLHHDSHGAYMCDLPAPLRNCLSDYGPIAAQVDKAIADAFGLHGPNLSEDDQREILRWDEAAREVEAKDLVPSALDEIRSHAEVASDRDVDAAAALWETPLHSAEAASLFEEAHRRIFP